MQRIWSRMLIRVTSPDPVLTGVMMAQTIQGIQDAGVIACAKHYIGNEQEHFRQAPESSGFGFKIDDSVSSNIDDVTMHELYLWSVLFFARCLSKLTSLGLLPMQSGPTSAQSCVLISK